MLQVPNTATDVSASAVYDTLVVYHGARSRWIRT
jgi:hypothetical protein